MRRILCILALPFLLTACALFFGNRGSDNQANQNSNEASPAAENNVLPAPPENFALLKGVNGTTGDADAYRTERDNKFIHQIVARITDPKAGHHYEGWLMKPAGDERIDTGRLVKKSNVWFLDFQSDTKFDDYTTIVVTDETNDIASVPGIHILEGSF